MIINYGSCVINLNRSKKDWEFNKIENKKAILTKYIGDKIDVQVPTIVHG